MKTLSVLAQVLHEKLEDYFGELVGEFKKNVTEN